MNNKKNMVFYCSACGSKFSLDERNYKTHLKTHERSTTQLSKKRRLRAEVNEFVPMQCSMLYPSDAELMRLEYDLIGRILK